MTGALASLRFASVCGRNPKCKKTNENESQTTFNCVSLLVCFHTAFGKILVLVNDFFLFKF